MLKTTRQTIKLSNLKVISSNLEGPSSSVFKVATSTTPVSDTIVLAYKGEIIRDAEGRVDLKAEMSKRPDALWVRAKAIEADRENDNGDFFSEEELLKSYKSFEGVPIFCNHENNDIEKARGKVVLAEWDPSEKSVYCTFFIDSKAHAPLCRAISEGYATDVSMGTQVEYSVCSVCKNKATTADSYCFLPGTNVLMSDLTVKPIEEVKNGEEVIDGFGKRTKVTKTFKHDHNDVVQVLTSRVIMDSLACTGNHPFLTQRRGKYKFVNAEDLDDKEVLFTPVVSDVNEDISFLEESGYKKNYPDASKRLARLVGYYAAEGCIAKNSKGEDYNIQLSFNQSETDILNDVRSIVSDLFEKKTDEYIREGHNGISVRIYDLKLASFLVKHVSGKARTKKFSSQIISMPNDLIAQVLNGYIEGDGHVNESNRGSVVIHSASINLTHQVYHLLNRLGASASINSFMQNGGPTNREASFRIYRISFAPTQSARILRNLGSEPYSKNKITLSANFVSEKTSKLKNVFTMDGKFAKASAYSIEEVPYNGPVYNLETEAHSYVANNVSVHNCDHIKTMKGRNYNGKKVYEENYGLKFIELSVVVDGACKSCKIEQVLDPEEVLSKAASIKDRLVKYQDNLRKEAGQDEVKLLNDAQGLLEQVSRTMLDQRQYLDMEFLSKLIDVLAQLQEVTDELVDQGYASIGGQPQGTGAGAGQEYMVPPIPESSTTEKELGMGALNPVTTGPAQTGIGKITEPATALSERRNVISSKIKDLRENIQKILEEQITSGGKENVNKPTETLAKLAKIWENPSVRSFKAEMADGEYRVVVGSEEVYGVKGGKKLASLRIDQLDKETQETLRSNTSQATEALLDAFKQKFASVKVAEKAPSNTKEQQAETLEGQLESQRVPLHPRTDEVRESTIEDQLDKKTTEYDYHSRTNDQKDSITEKQLAGDTGQYARQDKPRDEVMQGQLRDKAIKGNQTPAEKGGEWVAGVSDQQEQLMEGQLEDWKKAGNRHLPTQITEKQLSEQAEPWGRRIDSKEAAQKAVAAAMNAMVRTAKALGATPEEVINSIKKASYSVQSSLESIQIAVKVAGQKEERNSLFKRASFHGPNLNNATENTIREYVLGSLIDVGFVPELGIKVANEIVNKKNSVNSLSQAILADTSDPLELEKRDPFLKFRSLMEEEASQEYLKEVLADSDANSEDEEIEVLINPKNIKATEKDAFAEEAFKLASTEAQKLGFKITSNVHVKKADKGWISVVMTGKKTAELEEKTEAQAADKLANRKANREKVVEAQFGGPAGGAGGMPGGGGGTTMPPAADPMAGADPMGGAVPPPPVAGLSQDVGMEDPMGDDEEMGAGEALPPGSICPVCGSDNVDIRGGEFECKDCQAEGEFEIKIEVTKWPDTIVEQGGAEKGDDEEGIGDMGGGPGLEMPAAGGPPAPGVGVGQAFKLTPEMVKKAGNKPLGSYCPHCGSDNVKIAKHENYFSGGCNTCEGQYRIDAKVDSKNPREIMARIAWKDMNIEKFAKAEAEKNSIASKKNVLVAALKKAGLEKKFTSASIKDKALIIAQLADKGLLPK